ncbi:microfibril-associated glycoprotein 4-like [Engraulis encrasicolus]|uniref:microfibril-associated glycoprotein 4-like n=1 Tax=Engraulis encrasicolus TaxID=184585 RepID=UPI002FD60B2C
MLKCVQIPVFQLVVLLLPASLGSDLYMPLDCADIHHHEGSKPSGVYNIFPGGPNAPLKVYCDMETDGGGWTVFQKRMDGSVNFYRSWESYKLGFGDIAAEYWLGLDNMVLLSLRRRNELRVDMEHWDGNKAHAQYSSFSVDPEQLDYTLHLGTYVGGEAGDALKKPNGMKFSTYDKDQDTYDKNCASQFMGGFWYQRCSDANPNGLYIPDSRSPHGNVHVRWDTWSGSSVKTISMKMRALSKCSS